MVASDDATVAAPVLRRREPEPGDSGVFGLRRSDQYVTKWRRRRRREARKQRSVGAPAAGGPAVADVPDRAAGPFRRWSSSARCLPTSRRSSRDPRCRWRSKDGLEAAARAGTAAWFWPGDPGPLATQGAIYAAAAADRPAAGAPAVLDDLALSLGSLRAGRAEGAGDLVAALSGGDRRPQHDDRGLRRGRCRRMHFPRPSTRLGSPLSRDCEDWTWLAEEQAGAGTTGKIEGSLWPPYGAPESAHLYRTMTPTQLADVALAFLLEARERNPGAPEVNTAIALVRQLGG